MKQFLFIIFLLTAHFGGAQNWQVVKSAFTSGNIEQMAQSFDEEVEVCIGKDEFYLSPEETVQNLKQFFTKLNKPAFSVVHKGTSKGGNSHYIIGSLKSQNASYRVYVYASASDDNPKIQEIRIDQE